MKKYKIDIVDFYDHSEDVVAYGTKGHHDFELVKKAVIDGDYDEYNGIIDSLTKFEHVYFKTIPTANGSNSVQVEAGTRGAVPYTLWS